jgi:hypothetical protein
LRAAKATFALKAGLSVESDVLAGNLVLIDLDGPPLYLDVRLLMNPQRRLAKSVCDFTDFLRKTVAAAD